MSDSVALKSSLRKRLEHAMTLHVEAQGEECMDYLAHPDILVAEFCDSFLAAQEYDHREESFWAEGQTEAPRRRWVDHVVQRLIEQQNIQVPAEPAYGFRYLARPWRRSPGEAFVPGRSVCFAPRWPELHRPAP